VVFGRLPDLRLDYIVIRKAGRAQHIMLAGTNNSDFMTPSQFLR
jgi:hypothetical protein